MLARVSSASRLFVAILAVLLAIAISGDSSASVSTLSVDDGDVGGLIRAIHEANASVEPLTIVLADGGDYSLIRANNSAQLYGATGLPVITGTVTIEGNGSVIRRGSHPSIRAFRVFRVGPEGELNLHDLTIRNGAVNHGAGIFNEGNLLLTNSVIENNRALRGGGIWNSQFATMTILASSVRGNLAAHGAGGVMNRGAAILEDIHVDENIVMDGGGGGINNFGALTITASTVNGNVAGGESRGSGGGIATFSDLTLNHSVVAGNYAEADGGGILTSFSTVNLDVTDSVVRDNSARNGGGIISMGPLFLSGSTVEGNRARDRTGGGIISLGAATITHSTVSDNVATGGDGTGDGVMTASSGGIFHYSQFELLEIFDSTFSGNFSDANGGAILTLGDVVVTNSTISHNSATFDGGGIHLALSTVDLTITNSTISGNQAGRNGGGIFNDGGINMNGTLVAGNTAGAGPDISGSVLETSAYNIVGDGTGMTGLVDGVNGNQIGDEQSPIDPVLGPLRNNEGLTETMALLTGSPAIDAIPIGACLVETDQRGVDRPQGVGCDIGAFELVPLVE